MSTLSKKIALFDRDEVGELIPQEVDLFIDENDEDQKTLKGLKVKIIPLTRGELKKLISTPFKEGEEKDSDAELILAKCKDPAFTMAEIKHMKGYVSKAIVDTILVQSGLKIGKSKKESVLKAEDDFAKNS